MDCEREKFRVYVEKSGVMSILTDALVGLYELPQKPEDAMTFIRKALGQSPSEMHKITMLEDKVKELEEENKSLKKQLSRQQQQPPVEEAQQTRPEQ